MQKKLILCKYLKLVSEPRNGRSGGAWSGSGGYMGSSSSGVGARVITNVGAQLRQLLALKQLGLLWLLQQLQEQQLVLQVLLLQEELQQLEQLEWEQLQL